MYCRLLWQQENINLISFVFFLNLRSQKEEESLSSLILTNQLDFCCISNFRKLKIFYFCFKDFQKLSSTVQEFLLKLPDEEKSARLRDNLLQALHFLQLYYRELQNREKNTDPLQWNIDHSLSPLTPFREAPDKFEWDWINVDSQKVRQSLPRSTAESFKALPLIIIAVRDGDFGSVKAILKEGKLNESEFSNKNFYFITSRCELY